MPSRLTAVAIILLLVTGARGQGPVTLWGHGGWVGAVAFSPDGRRLAVGASDGSVWVWNGREQVRDGSVFWDMVKRDMVISLQRHDDAVAALAWSADGRTVVSGGHDRIVMLHEPGLRAGGRYHVLRGHTGAVLSIALSPDGKRLYTGSIDGTIRVWDTEARSASKVLRDHTSWVNGLALDGSGTLLASASSDQSLRLRRAPGFEPFHTFRVKEGEIRAVAISPDRKLVAAGLRYGGVRVWDVEAKKEVAALKAHAGETWAVAFTPDGKLLASGGGDWNQPGEVRLWEVGPWRERATLPHTGEVLCLAVSSDGRLLAAGSWDRTVRVWDLTRLPERARP